VLKKRRVYALGVVLLLSSIAAAALVYTSPKACGVTLGSATVSKFDLQSEHFGAITKFRLPGNDFPNGITVASDGSVWFGEQTLPGVGHLYRNGTLIEYGWPISYSPSTTAIWGVADWHGRIWASDALGAQIVSLDPSTATVTAIKLGNVQAFPYTITIGADNALWFTELYGSTLGRIDAHCKLTEYPIPKNFGGTPAQVEFRNATLGYYADVGNATSALSEILSFNTNNFAPQPIDGTFRPLAASSLAIAPDGLWVAQHAASNLAYYNFQTRSWSLFPTTPVNYIATTLPYFVAANGSLVWFNEHYANRIGVIDTQRGLLTEYSLSNPPANKTSQIDNALTFALGGSRVWFTELTADYVGYVDASYKPSYCVYASEERLSLRAGGNASLTIILKGASSVPLKMSFADSENYTSLPSQIAMRSSETMISTLNGEDVVNVNINTKPQLTPANYTILITVTNGLINQAVYLDLQVTE